MITLGIDEVGRGCLAGPMVVGAVILDKPIAGLKDSKKLTKLQRDRLDKQIRGSAKAFALGWVSPAEIDELGLTKAETLAIERSLEKIVVDYDEIIIDGDYNFLLNNPMCRALVKADQTIPAVSAASIIAKVARDNYMAEQARLYPSYGFENHVGYGTAVHLAAIKEFGICELHRRSFKPVQKVIDAQITTRKDGPYARLGGVRNLGVAR